MAPMEGAGGEGGGYDLFRAVLSVITPLEGGGWPHFILAFSKHLEER